MEDVHEMGTEGTHACSFQNTADSDEDTIISDATFSLTSGEITKYQSNTKIIPTIYISPTLESNIDFWEEVDDQVDYEDNVTSVNSHAGTSKAVGKSISGDAVSDSQEDILDSFDNNNASGNVCSEEYIISMSSGDNTVKETTTVPGNTAIAPSGDAFYKTPGNMVVDETTVSAINEISTKTIITKGDLCNSVDSEEAIPIGGNTSGEVVDFTETNGIEAILDSMTYATKEGVSTNFPEEFSNSSSPVSGPVEISHHALKEISLSGPETTGVFSDNRTDVLFGEDASTTTPTFSATFQHAPSVVSETTVISSSDSNNTAVENPKSIEGPTNKIDAVIKEVTTSTPSIVIASREMCNASPEDNVDVSENRTSSYSATTDSGNFSIISDENMLTTLITEAFSNSSLSGESTSMLSSDDVRNTEICEEKAITESENPTVAPSSISSFEYTNTTEYIATLDSANSTIKEDNIVTDPASTNETEQPFSLRKGTNAISKDIINTTVKEIFSDTTTVSSSTESIVDPISVCAKTIAIHGNTGINMAGNVTTSCGTTTVSESVVSITLGKNNPYIHKTSTNSCGDYDDGKETICKDINHSLFDEDMIITSSEEASCQNTTFDILGYVSSTPPSQNASGYGAKTEPEKSSETITVDNSMTFGNNTITHGVTATNDVTHTIPTTIAITESSREIVTKNIVLVLEDHSITATTGDAPVFHGISSTTSEQGIITTTSGDVESMASRETAMIHIENDFIIASCTDSENTKVTSSIYRDSVPSSEDTVSVTCTNGTTSTSEEVSNTVPNQVPIEPYQTTIYTETATMKPTCKGSQITDTSINSSVTSAQEANSTMESAYRDTSITAIDKKLTSEYPSISHVSPPLGKETSDSDLTTRIQDDIDHGRNVSQEGLITPVPSPSSSADITPPISISSRSQPPLESTNTPKDKNDEASNSGASSACNVALERNLSVASTDDKNNPTSDTILLVSGGFMSTSESAPSISLFSRELNTYDVVGNTTTNLDDSLLIDTIDSASTSPDTSVKKWYGEENSSVHCETTTVLDYHISSFSGESSAQASTEQTSDFSYTTNTSKDAHLKETFASVHNKITTNLEEEDAKDDTVTRDIYATVDVTINPPSVETSRELASSGELATTATLLEDAVALVTVKETTSTNTDLKNAATIIQDFSEDTETVSKNKLAYILHDTSQVGEIISSEKSTSDTLADTKMVPDSEVLTSELMSSAEILEDTTDLVSDIAPKRTLSNDLSMMTTDIPAVSGTASSLNRTVPIFDDGTSVSEITMCSEEILSSGNESTVSYVDLNIQNQIPLTEASTVAPGKISFSSGETVTTIPTSEAEMIINNVIEADNTNSGITDDANIPRSLENVTKIIVPCMSPIDANTGVPIPLDTNTSAIALQETEPLGETFISGNAVNPITEDNNDHPDSCIPSEAFSTLGSTPHEHNGHPFTSSFDTVSTLGETARIAETRIAFENSMPAPNPFADETVLTDDIGDAGPSKDITNITSEDSTISGRMNTGESEGTALTSIPEHLSTTSEAIILSSENDTTELTGSKCLSTTSVTSGDITATTPKDNTIDLYVLDGANIPSTIRDTHTTTVLGFRGTTSVIKNSSTPIVEIISNTQSDTSTPSDTKPHKETSASKKTCVPMAHVAARETSKVLPKRGKADTSDLANSMKGTTTTTHTKDPTSTPRDYNYVSDSIPTSRGKVTAMIAIFEDVGRQNESLSSRATFSFAETSVRQVYTKSGMNLPCRDVISTSSVPTKCKDPILTPVAASTAAITRASETSSYHSKTKSLVKSDPRKRSTISTTDSVLGTVSCPRETIPSPSSVILDSSPEDTSKGISTVGTAFGLREAETSPVTIPFEETHISDNAATPVDISIKTDKVGTEETPISNININLEKYTSIEVKTSPEEIVSARNINTARDNFFYGAIKSSVDSLVSTDVGPLSDSVSKSTVISVETATHEDVVSSEKIETSRNASVHKVVAVDITANSISSSENVTSMTSSDNSPDDMHNSGNIITINSETNNLRSPTVPKGAILLEDGTTNSSIYENTSECLNNHDNAICAPENTFPTVSEDAAVDSGSRVISPDDAVTIGLQKTSDTSTREICNTTGADLIAHSGEKPVATLKEATPEETKANAPWETEVVSTLTLEETIIATPEKTDTVITESYMPTEESSAISSGESGDDASGETNMVTFGKIIGPSSAESSTTSREPEDINPREMDVSATFREIINNTKDSPEHSFSDPEELHVDAPGEIHLAQPDNITGDTTKETSVDLDEATMVISRKRSTTVSSKNLPPVTSGAHFAISPGEISPPASLGASATLGKTPKGNVLIATTSKRSHMASPRGISSASQEENGTIRPVVPPSYWSIMITGIVMTFSLVAGLCMVIYYITFYILVTYSTS
ncbi:serine-rich adhesin for platelets [Anolis carolinensis]|uniref:serine-rich adhesin for platelets n=1 Tax=Anolis carolinensis TaxID=28377 RepID=UPI000462DEF9|nr:PREDICTED: serine-rich adhesin for platelets isoform X2 [Anolis carolinensis]|eukprot:XP_008103852.1 PREDICTED: serine-rich adhesin for platelets isoform X2 [Anolis carolinensis]